MQIHELNNFNGRLDSSAFAVVDNGIDTGKISIPVLLQDLSNEVEEVNARIDNIITSPAPTEQEIIDARLGQNHVEYASLGDAIREQFSDVYEDLDLLNLQVLSANKWNPDDETPGKVISNNVNVNYGGLVDQAGYTVSGFIPAIKDDVIRWVYNANSVNPGDLLARGTNAFRIAEYDAYYNCLTVSSNWVALPYTVQQGDAAYIRVNVLTEATNSIIFGDSSTAQIYYDPFDQDFERIRIIESDTAEVPEVLARVGEISAFFNLPLVTDNDLDSMGSNVSINGDTITVDNTTGYWDISGVKPFKPIEITGVEYVGLALGKIGANYYGLAVCLNSSSNFGKLFLFNIGGSAFQTTPSKVLNGTWISSQKIKITKTGESEITLLYNGSTTVIDLSNYTTIGSFANVEYTKMIFGSILNSDRTFNIDNKAAKINDYWSGSTWFAFGDSITGMGYYIPQVDEELGTISTAYGHGGASYAQLASYYTEMIGGDTPDLITLFAGTNDFGHSGTIDAMKGGMRTIIEGLYQAFPKVTLIIIAPLQRDYTGADPGETAGLGPNSLGLYLVDYVDAIKEIAQEYSIPCLNLYNEGGINSHNASEKTSDGLHPNSAYGVCIGHMIANFAKNYLPFK